MNEFDVWRTCRTCLSRAAELIPLNSAYDVKGVFEEISANKTNGDLLMECANVEFNEGDGLPQNVCIECVSSLRAAFAYKQMCERSDVKLRHIFNNHLTSVQVKIERIDETNESEAVRPLEEHWFDDAISEPFEKFSHKNESETDDDWTMPMQTGVDDEANDFPADSIAVPNKTNEVSGRAKESNSPCIVNSVECSTTDNAKRVKTEDGRLMCEICNLSFLNSKTLTNHYKVQSHLDRLNGTMKVAEGNGGEPSGDPVYVEMAKRAQCLDGRYACELCKSLFTDRSSLRRHIRAHLNVNFLHCPFCDRRFSSSGYLKTHIDTQHAKGFSCEKCDKVFDAKRALRRHTFDAHRPPKPEKRYICEICSRVFNRINNLNQHRVTHSGEKNFSCDICQQKVSTKQVLKDHMRKHGDKSNYYRFLCPHCGQKFTTTTHMHGHIRTKHTGATPYKCESCEQAFCRYDLLAQHKLKHVPRFICSVCGKSLSSNERLKTHSRVHTGEKPYQCSICNQAFAQSKTLRNHLRGHGGDVPNKCNVCGDVFTNPRWLLIHRRQFDHQN